MHTADYPPRQVSTLAIELPAYTKLDKQAHAYVKVPAQSLRVDLSIDLQAIATRLAWRASQSPRRRAILAKGAIRLVIRATEPHPDQPLPPIDGTLPLAAVTPLT